MNLPILTNKEYQALGKVSRVLEVQVLDDFDGSVIRRLKPSDTIPQGHQINVVKSKVLKYNDFKNEEAPY